MNHSWVAQLRVSEHFTSWCSSQQVTLVSNNKPVGGSEGKESAFSVGEPGSVPGLGRSPGEGNGWLPTPVILHGEFHGWRSLVGCSPWSRKESDTTETSLSLCTFMHWRRKWQPTPVFLPGESQRWRSCRLWAHTELDTTEAT